MTLTELTQPTGQIASAQADGDSTVVSLRGEADVFTLPVLVDVLTRAIADSDGPVIIDLAASDFIDTATVRALGRAWRFLDDRGRVLTVRSPSAIAVRLFTLFGLSHLLDPARTMAA